VQLADFHHLHQVMPGPQNTFHGTFYRPDAIPVTQMMMSQSNEKFQHLQQTAPES